MSCCLRQMSSELTREVLPSCHIGLFAVSIRERGGGRRGDLLAISYSPQFEACPNTRGNILACQSITPRPDACHGGQRRSHRRCLRLAGVR